MLNIILSGKEFGSTVEYILDVNINSITSNFIFKPNLLEYSFNTQVLDTMIRNYNDNYASGEYIEFRDLYKGLELNKKKNIERDLARIFIVTSAWMHFGYMINDNRNIFIEHINESKDIFLNDINILEWSGDTGNQPGVYFIKKKYLSEYSDAILKLYNFGLLYKYSLNINNDKYDNYIFPFIETYETNIRNYDLLPLKNVLNKIIKDRNVDIVNFINGTRNK
jgi:hypothetical protein